MGVALIIMLESKIYEVNYMSQALKLVPAKSFGFETAKISTRKKTSSNVAAMTVAV